MFSEITYIPSPQLSPRNSISDWRPPSEEPSIEESLDDSLASDSGSEAPVDHLIFVIHGIGQQTEQYGQFYEHIDNLRETTRQVLQAKIPYQSIRIELIPIEWHRHIHEQTDPIMNSITLKSIPTIRLIENDYLADVLYYFSKERGQSIIDNVTQLFNTAYHNFLEKHPDFNGRIAIIGYSLGGVIVWDILSNQRQPESPTQELEYQKVVVNFPKLNFKPHYFFGFGSPIGAVLAIRGQSPIHYHPEQDIVFENIFHPFDPLAYRFEPLLNNEYAEEDAVLVDRSIPIGPTFSFPSMTSIPGLNFLSFFSWKTSSQISENQSSENITEEAQEATKMLAKAGEGANDDEVNRQANDSDEQGKSFLSSVSTFWEYFSSTGATIQDNNIKNENGTGNTSSKHPESGLGFIRNDPLHEEISQTVLRYSQDQPFPMMANPEHLMVDFGLFSPTSPRPTMRRRSRTFNSPKDGTTQQSTKRPGFVRHNTSIRSRQRHLVEVLGIDGVRTELSGQGHHDLPSRPPRTPLPLESTPIVPEYPQTPANEAMSKTSALSNIAPEVEANTPMGTASQSTDNVKKDIVSASENTHQTKDNTSQSNDSGKRCLWEDLRQELDAPGPALQNPGQSKESVAKEATQSDDKQNDQSSAAEEDKKTKRLLHSLPQGRRIDYVLQPESFMSMIANEYLVGMRAHFSYWTNKDLLWHIVQRLHNIEGTKD